mgnify:CR=1 FL=1
MDNPHRRIITKAKREIETSIQGYDYGLLLIISENSGSVGALLTKDEIKQVIKNLFIIWERI